MPPPMHIVTTTYLTPRRLPSMRACMVMRAPLMPYGWPIEIAPPSTLNRSAECRAGRGSRAPARRSFVQFPQADVVDLRLWRCSSCGTA